MALSLADFSATGSIYLQARITAGGVTRTNGQFNIWSSSEWTNDATTGTLEEGSMQVSGLGGNEARVSRFARWDESSRDRMIINGVADDADDDLGGIFSGSTNMCTVVFEDAQGTISMFSVAQRRGGNATFVDWWRGGGQDQLTTEAWSILSGIGAGRQFIFAFHTGTASYGSTPASDASFEATAGSPTAAFTPSATAPAGSDAAFSARAGSPTAAFTPEAVAPTPGAASFSARAGDPTATFALQFDHTSTVAFEARAGSPTAAFTPESVTPRANVSFAARAGTPDVTIEVSFDHETRVIFPVRAGSPTVLIIPEAIRTRDPAAEALAHQVDHVNLTTTYRGDRMAEPLEKRAWDIRTYAVSLGEALAESDVISRVDEVAVVDERGVPVDGYSTSGITSSAGIVTFTCEGGDMGDEHRVRIRCPLTGGTQRVEVTVPLKVLA